MHPAYWTGLAVVLGIAGIYAEWRAPRQRIARVLQVTQALREGRSHPLDEGILRGVGRWLLSRLRPWLPGAQIAEFRRQLLWAGQPLGLSAEEFYFARFGLAAAAALVALLYGSFLPKINPLGLMAIAGALGFLLPERLLQHRIAERERQIRIQLPQFVHLLATAVECGLPVVDAVRRVADEMPGLLSAEMLRTVREMAAGKPPAVAWQHLMDRTPCQELREVVTVIMQSQELGVSVADQLRMQVRSLRQRKQQTAKERAEAASVQMRVPTIVFILIPTMVILLGPAVVTVMRQLRGG
ncbi:MAG TPA: type II secretion system F family protein [Symbiobacteriaceae bacterium]